MVVEILEEMLVHTKQMVAVVKIISRCNTLLLCYILKPWRENQLSYQCLQYYQNCIKSQCNFGEYQTINLNSKLGKQRKCN